MSRGMLKIILSILTEWVLAQWMFLHLHVPGTCSFATVHQPPVLTAALDHDVIMPCQLNLSINEQMRPPVLYWIKLDKNIDVWPPSKKYKERVELQDEDPYSSNKSIVFKNVRWADSGKYLCKVSVSTETNRFRKFGNETLLVVHDTMIFNLTGHNDSLLSCEVNVNPDPGFVLSIFHKGYENQTVNSSVGDYIEALPNVTLLETISPKTEGQYECQLHLNGDLITSSNFYYKMPVVGEPGEADKTSTTTEPDVEQYPEPWFLYVALLLVPVTVMLGFLTGLLMCTTLSLFLPCSKRAAS